MTLYGLWADQMENILPSFSVVPKKTFLGFDKSQGHCFTMKKTLTKSFVEYFSITREDLQREIKLVSADGEYPAVLRLIVQDKSKPNKSNIKGKLKQ